MRVAPVAADPVQQRASTTKLPTTKPASTSTEPPAVPGVIGRGNDEIHKALDAHKFTHKDGHKWIVGRLWAD